MKVILTGATGLIGGATLDALLSQPSVTQITLLSRRALPNATNSPKLTTIIIEDFKAYSDATIAQLRGADACIWCLGTPTGGKEVHHDFTVAGLEAVKKASVGGAMRFVYVSGGLVEPDQEKTLWFLGKERKMRGQVEHIVTDVEKEYGSGGEWKSFIARPAYVTKGESLVRYVSSWYIPVQTLGAALAHVAVNGCDKQRLENTDLREIGTGALAATATSKSG